MIKLFVDDERLLCSYIAPSRLTSTRAKKTGKTGFGKALNPAGGSCKVIVVGEGDARTAD